MEISKIKIDDQEYNIKDEKLRQMILEFIGEEKSKDDIFKTV